MQYVGETTPPTLLGINILALSYKDMSLDVLCDLWNDRSRLKCDLQDALNKFHLKLCLVSKMLCERYLPTRLAGDGKSFLHLFSPRLGG